MWVNYMKNNVCVFECRTTSIAESMHSSMKSEYEDARSNFSLHKLTNIILNKLNRKHENTYRLNANSVDSSRANSGGNEEHYLTDYAYNMIMQQLSLSKSCRDIRYDKTTCFVYKPEDVNKK